MTDFAYLRLDAGLPMPAIFAVNSRAPLGQVFADLLLLIEASQEGEWEGQIRYVPL